MPAPNTTLKSEQFIPEVATEVATAIFPNVLALGFAGSPFVQPLPPVDQIGTEGDVIKFPRFDVLGDFADMAEDTALTPERMKNSMDMAVVQVGGKAIEVTDFAQLAARGDPSVELGNQVPVLAARYIDKKFIDEAETTPLVQTATQTLTWEVFVDAVITKWGDKAMMSVGGIVVHSKVMGDVMKLPEFKRADQLGMAGSLITGFIGALGSYPVFVSDRLTVTSGAPNTYNNLVLKRGALGLLFQRMLLVERFRDVLKKNWVISADVRFAVHLFFDNPMPAIKLVTQ